MLFLERIRLTNTSCVNHKEDHGQATMVNNDELKVTVEIGSYRTTKELAPWFNVSIPTILTHLQYKPVKLKKLKMGASWFDLQRTARVETWLCLWPVQVLNRIMTCDEKWILYDNCKRTTQWLIPCLTPQQCPKAKLTYKKMMVTFDGLFKV